MLWILTCFLCFYPRPVLAYGYCCCLCLSVCPSMRQPSACLHHIITCNSFKLGPPNLDQKCKIPWLMTQSPSSACIYLNCFTVQTVSQPQLYACLLIEADEGIWAFNITFVCCYPLAFQDEGIFSLPVFVCLWTLFVRTIILHRF